MDTLFIDALAVFLPLLGALIAGFLKDKGACFVTCGAMLIAAGLSLWIFYDVTMFGHERIHILAPWIEAGPLKTFWALRIDTLSAIMIAVVNGISAMVHLYSIGYMKGDKSVPRFMAYLSLFTFFMLMLVSADDLLQMFFGWEGVGLSSYLLIGFWYEKPKPCSASMKAFLVNRVGDFGFLLGLFACYQLFGSLSFDLVFAGAMPASQKTFTVLDQAFPAVTVTCLLLFMGAMGKSAQLLLHTWLPDAMEGPTPVSALIHAATMVTAGVFMIARLSPLFEYAPGALMVVALVGAVTAFVAATIGLTQFDIKRVIAYSTMSQLGYMFFAAGVSAYGASMFHLMTHAFFKALLFLAAGSVIHALAGEQDMRKMGGGLWRKIPFTYALMWIGSLALAGIGIEGLFGFAGFYSKDMILEAAFSHGSWYGYLAYVLGLLAAFMTAFYSWRLLFLTFHGPVTKENEHALAHAHESSGVMLGPLVPLALGAVFVGAFFHSAFASGPDGAFWQGSIFALAKFDSAHQEAPLLVRLLPLIMALLGIGASWAMYRKWQKLPALVVQKLGRVYQLVVSKYYFDEIYDVLFVRFLPRLGAFLWRTGDDRVIDRFGPNGVASTAQKLGAWLRLPQTGLIYHYAFAMAAGLVLLVGWFLVQGGAL